MPTHHDLTGSGCPACEDCPSRDGSAEDQPDGPRLVGSRLVMVTSGLFVGPVVLAIAGAVWAGENSDAQLLGATAGLALGMAASIGIARLLRRKGAKETPSRS